MRFLISYPQTNWDYAKFRLNRIIRGKDKSNDVFTGSPGGKIQLLEQREPLGKFRLLDEIYPTKPFGMEYVAGEGLYFITGLPCCMNGQAGDEHILRLNDQGEIDLVIKHPLFSQMRSLRRTKNGILVTSSGIDAILEVNLQGEIIWDWFGTEQGYSTRYGGGERTIDRDFDHRTLCYSGKLQTTHLNSAIVDPYDESKVLTILFYQGKVARIDRETLQLEHVIENLNGAHHIRPHSRGYMLSNSRKGETHIYDRNFQLLEIIDGTNALFPVKWVQDTVEMPSGSHLIADCNTFNLRERTADGSERKFNTKMPNRIFQIEPVGDDFSFNTLAHLHFPKD
ncbi:MAG: RHS repeat protein [Methyloprofundus sp.]|nr:RHS repeat protein [Methyloprofundus sp.]MDT8426081.1 RHS repeat protein [Methyloprofundus sp.]